MADMSPSRRIAPTAAERAYAMRFLPGAIKVPQPTFDRGDTKRSVTQIPIPKEAMLENQGASPLEYLDFDEAAAVAVSNNMANGRAPRYSDVPSFRAPAKVLTKPRFVPARSHFSILNDPKWAPPEEVKPKPMDVSTAEIVEKPLNKLSREALEHMRQIRECEPDMTAASAAAEFARRKRHFIAYDDNDMFAYTTKHIPLPPYNPQLPHFFDIVREGTVFVTRAKMIVVSQDRKAAVHIPMENEKLSSEGWSMHVLRGPAPPPGTALVPFSEEWLIGVNETRSYSLTTDGWAWRRAIIPDFEAMHVDLADLVDENTVYIRNSKSRHMLMYYAWEDLDQEDIDFLYQGLDLDLRRGRLSFPKVAKKHNMRTLPSKEEIHIIAGAGGVALSYLPTHTWIFLFDRTAKSYIPHQRIDFVAPRAVVLPSHIYFLAENHDARGCTSVVARMSRSREKDFEVDSFPKPDDVTIGVMPGVIAACGAMPESFSGTGQTALLVSDDWRSAVVVEFDRRQKLLKLHGGSPKPKARVVAQIMTPGT